MRPSTRKRREQQRPQQPRKRRIAVIGGFGQLGEAIHNTPHAADTEYYLLSRSLGDLCSSYSISRIKYSPDRFDIVINCGAYTNVERAEEQSELAEEVNACGVALLSKICKECGIPLIHISTDYVFGGDTQRNTPYDESDSPAPINAYGLSKLHGEEALRDNDLAIVIRTSWLYSPWGNNFYRTISSLSSSQPEISVVDDQRGTPTSALSLARFIVDIIDSGKLNTMHGIYHYTDSGEATWYDFARAIVELTDAECNVVPITSAERKTLAARPHYSVLGKRRITELGVTPPPWREALAEVINFYRR